MSIADKLTQLTNIRSNIRTKLTEKGVEASDHDFKDFATDIENIQTGITPTGTIEITENGTYDVSEKAEAVVDVSGDDVLEKEASGELYSYTYDSNKPLVRSAFANLKNLESITINNVEEIPQECFSTCSKLASVSIRTSQIRKFGTSPFYHNSAMRRLYVDSFSDYCRCEFTDSTHLAPFSSSLNGRIFENGVELFELNIPDDVTTIYKEQFRGLRYANKIVLPRNLATIGNSAFGEFCLASQNGVVDMTKLTLTDGHIKVNFGSNMFYSANNFIILFANEEIANEAKITTNLSIYANRIHWVGE